MPPKRKKRFHGLYYHSSPPRVLPMNGQTSGETKKKSADDFSIRLSTIRIWMHEKDIGKLTRVLWAGQGNKLRQQASTNPKVKRFLAAVPYAMNSVKDVHQAVIDNSLETLQANMEPPVPPSLITCKDANGLNVIHKAAGLGHTMILEYLLGIWPDGANETDMTGKTPLHWAASGKNNMRCYTLLTQAGCEEDVLDYKMKTPAYYKQRHNEIERSFLTLVPEAPRVSQDVPTDWDALSSDDSEKKSEIKISNGKMRAADVIPNGMNLLTSRSEANSIENISEPDLFEGSVNSTEEPAGPSPPPSEEPDATDTKDGQLENGHLTNGDDHISEPNSEPPTPPKTPEEKPVKDEEQMIIEPPQQQKDENVSNALIDQNSDHQANGINEDEDTTYDEAFENGDHEDQGDENENEEENNNEVNGHSDGVTDDKQEEDNEEKSRKDKETDATTDANENNEEDEVSAEQTDGTEKTKDVTENLIENIEVNGVEIVAVDKEDKEKYISEDKEENESEDKGEDEVDAIENKKEDDVVVENDKIDQEEVEDKKDLVEMKPDLEGENSSVDEEKENEANNDDAATEVDPNVVDENTAKPSSPPLEKAEREDPPTEKANPEDAPQLPQADDKETDDENNNVKDDNNTGKLEGQNKENDEDDDDQEDVELATVNTASEDPPQYEGENIPEFDDKMTTDSPTPSLAIEGFIAGDSEDYQVQSESAAYLDDEEKYIEAIIDAGDMEQLAALVLNGDGKKILNRKSTQPEIQAFLNNVPAYMSKISRVHEAARQGTLYQLQSALDRRKFAIAKDEMSPCGASPLHVAVLFGHAEIVRYLAGRFPETTSAVDDDGRTALHYAATIKDNGHFFNLLVHLGGNPKATDKLGNTAELYTNEEQARGILTYKELLRRFGAEALEDEMLNDQGKAENYSQNEIFKTEQGRYLASSLGDPLIKGLTEIAEKRPSDPVAYLTGFLQNFLQSRQNNRDNDTNTSDTNSTALVNSEPDAIDSPIKRNGIDSALVEERMSSPEESTPKSEDRDEHGQSLLHFACARSHRRNGLLNLVEESQIDVTFRDELYRTARDVSLQANQPGNAKEIDRYVLSLAVVGDTKAFENLALAGYDHILDVVDDEGSSIVDLAQSRGHDDLVDFLSGLRNLEETREELHQAIREGDFEKVKGITATAKGKWLIKAKNYYGRTALHVAVLKELEEVVEYFVNTSPDALKYGDNLERTPLHYAMGTNSVEGVSRILIRKGAKRTIKDLKGRQPSYYFMNKADILRLQEEEDEHR